LSSVKEAIRCDIVILILILICDLEFWSFGHFFLYSVHDCVVLCDYFDVFIQFDSQFDVQLNTVLQLLSDGTCNKF